VAAPVALEMQPHGASIDPRVDPSESDAGLDQRFTALARARGLLRRALAAVAGEFVLKRVLKRDWERPGSARLRDDATERAGVGSRSFYDLARVAGALRTLPALELPLVRYGAGARIAARIDSSSRPTISSISERVVQSGGASATHSQRERTMSPRSQARWVTAAG